jgi:hypothetical protein
MENAMKLTRILAVLGLILTLTLSASTARGDMMEGSISISALWAEMDDPDIASSSTFTPVVSNPGEMYLAGGTDDLAGLGLAVWEVTLLNINTPSAWTFSNTDGIWATSSFVNGYPAADNGFLNFILTGTLTPSQTGSMSSFAPTPGEVRISLSQSGSRASWGGTMDMVPEPMSMSALALGGLALLRRRYRK